MSITGDHLAAHFMLTADLYVQIERTEAERDAVRAKNAELHSVVAERDAKIAELEQHLSVVERDAALHGIS